MTYLFHFHSSNKINVGFDCIIFFNVFWISLKIFEISSFNFYKLKQVHFSKTMIKHKRGNQTFIKFTSLKQYHFGKLELKRCFPLIL